MKIAVQQPQFLPWPAYWHRALCADVFVLWSEVDYSHGEHINRVLHNGAWLSLPVSFKLGDTIQSTLVADDKRRLHKLLRTVQHVSGPYKGRLHPILQILEGVQPGDSLSDVNEQLMRVILTVIGGNPSVFHKPIAKAEGETKTDRLVSVIRQFSTEDTVYLSGRGARAYTELDRMPGIEVRWQSLAGFDPTMSILQLIAHTADPKDRILTCGGWE